MAMHICPYCNQRIPADKINRAYSFADGYGTYCEKKHLLFDSLTMSVSKERSPAAMLLRGFILCAVTGFAFGFLGTSGMFVELMAYIDQRFGLNGWSASGFRIAMGLFFLSHMLYFGIKAILKGRKTTLKEGPVQELGVQRIWFGRGVLAFLAFGCGYVLFIR